MIQKPLHLLFGSIRKGLYLLLRFLEPIITKFGVILAYLFLIVAILMILVNWVMIADPEKYLPTGLIVIEFAIGFFLFLVVYGYKELINILEVK